MWARTVLPVTFLDQGRSPCLGSPPRGIVLRDWGIVLLARGIVLLARGIVLLARGTALPARGIATALWGVLPIALPASSPKNGQH